MDNGKVYMSGRYFVGPKSKFILFPSKDQIVSVDDIHVVNSMSSYEIGVSAIYSIDEDMVYTIYSDYQDMESFEKSMIRVLNHTFSTRASLLNYSEYFENQAQAQDELRGFLKEEWEEMGADIESFFIDYVTYVDSIESKLTQKQIVGLNNTYQEKYKEYNQMLNRMSKMRKENETKTGELYANATARLEYNKVIGQYNTTKAQANMMACVLSMYTGDGPLKDIANGSTGEENTGGTDEDNTGTQTTSNDVTESESDTSSTVEGDLGIGFSVDEFIDFMRNRAILSAKSGDGDTAVLELTNYIDL